MTQSRLHSILSNPSAERNGFRIIKPPKRNFWIVLGCGLLALLVGILLLLSPPRDVTLAWSLTIALTGVLITLIAFYSFNPERTVLCLAPEGLYFPGLSAPIPWADILDTEVVAVRKYVAAGPIIRVLLGLKVRPETLQELRPSFWLRFRAKASRSARHTTFSDLVIDLMVMHGLRLPDVEQLAQDIMTRAQEARVVPKS